MWSTWVREWRRGYTVRSEMLWRIYWKSLGARELTVDYYTQGQLSDTYLEHSVCVCGEGIRVVIQAVLIKYITTRGIASWRDIYVDILSLFCSHKFCQPECLDSSVRPSVSSRAHSVCSVATKKSSVLPWLMYIQYKYTVYMAGCIFFNKVWQWRFWIHSIVAVISQSFSSPYSGTFCFPPTSYSFTFLLLIAFFYWSGDFNISHLGLFPLFHSFPTSVSLLRITPAYNFSFSLFSGNSPAASCRELVGHTKVKQRSNVYWTLCVWHTVWLYKVEGSWNSSASYICGLYSSLIWSVFVFLWCIWSFKWH